MDSIVKKIIKFRDDRDWEQFHDPKNLAAAISIEAAELQEIFLWMKNDDSRCLPDEKIDKVREEAADILIFLTYLCNHFGIDMLDAVEKKLLKNDMKYPVNKAKGSSKKYTEI